VHPVRHLLHVPELRLRRRQTRQQPEHNHRQRQPHAPHRNPLPVRKPSKARTVARSSKETNWIGECRSRDHSSVSYGGGILSPWIGVKNKKRRPKPGPPAGRETGPDSYLPSNNSRPMGSFSKCAQK